MNGVKNYLHKKNNPEFAMQEVMAGITDKIDTLIEKRFSALEQELKGKEANMDMVDKITRNVLKDIKGDKGDFVKGDDGLTPTDDELRELIKPLIPEVQDGHTPTTDEILAIIKPLIPKVKDGATPTTSELLELITPLIPELPQIKIPKDGSPDTPQEVATKLNTLEEVLDTKVLKGFKKIIKQLEDKIFYAGKQKSGGGMGMPIHETFSVSGSTTSITLSYNVAANGRAIFTMRYQGQSLHWGEHYTVSGKVISLLFTPVDNSTVDISYIRTN